MEYDRLFETTAIGTCVLKNRFAMAPLGPLGMSDSQGGWSQRGIDYYVARARGGVGLIHTGITFVENDIEQHAICNCPCSTQNPAHFIRTSREMTERVHAYGAKLFLQMTAGFGRVSVPKAWGIFPPVAPSEIQHRWSDIPCRALTLEEIHTLVKRFGEGAFYAKNAGFDGIQIHAVHEGYLLDQFTIALFNHRTDAYGGSLENRLRIVREIREEIGNRCGADFPVTMRFSPKSFIKALRVGALPGEEFEEMGRDLPEGLEVAQALQQFGYDALDVDVGSYDAWWWSHPPMYQKKGLYLPYCKAVKEVVHIPVICAGRMDDPEMATAALADGSCDIISLGRPLLADPDYVKKLMLGKRSQIRPCISCQEGCMGRVQKYSQLSCAVNPECGREESLPLTQALQQKKILIVGGGPAGCEAARVLALRGYAPVLYEAGSRLGGSLLAGGVPDFKEDELALADWYAQELERLGVEVRLNRCAEPETIRAAGADVVIFATGGQDKLLPGLENNQMVCTAKDALLGNRTVGKRIVIAGSGTVACECALWLKARGKEVTIAARGAGILMHGQPSCSANSAMLKELIAYNGIPVRAFSQVTKAENGRVTLLTNGAEEQLAADTVVSAIGYLPNRALYDACSVLGCDSYVIGDASSVTNIMYAIWSAHEIARWI